MMIERGKAQKTPEKVSNILQGHTKNWQNSIKKKAKSAQGNAGGKVSRVVRQDNRKMQSTVGYMKRCIGLRGLEKLAENWQV